MKGGGEKAIYESGKKKGDMMMLMSNTDDPLLSRSVYGLCACVLKTGPATGGEKFFGKQSCHAKVFICCIVYSLKISSIPNNVKDFLKKLIYLTNTFLAKDCMRS